MFRYKLQSVRWSHHWRKTRDELWIVGSSLDGSVDGFRSGSTAVARSSSAVRSTSGRTSIDRFNETLCVFFYVFLFRNLVFSRCMPLFFFDEEVRPGIVPLQWKLMNFKMHLQLQLHQLHRCLHQHLDSHIQEMWSRWFGCQPKNNGKNPKSSILIGVGTIIFTIHFGGFFPPLFLVQHPFLDSNGL